MNNNTSALRRSSDIILLKRFFTKRKDELARSTLHVVTAISNTKFKIFVIFGNIIGQASLLNKVLVIVLGQLSFLSYHNFYQDLISCLKISGNGKSFW